MMDEILTIEEMKARFQAEWLLVEEPQTDEYYAVKKGRVRCHSKVKADIYKRIAELRPKSCAFVYTGEWKLPEKTALMI